MTDLRAGVRDVDARFQSRATPILAETMKHIARLTLTFLILCSAVRAQEAKPRFPPAAPSDVGMDAEKLEELARFVEDLVKRDEVPGAELLLIRDDKTVLHRAFGWRDRDERRAMEPNTIFCVRSMTKPVAGTAAGLLIEEKKLALSDKVAKHLPSFDNDRSRGITVEMLLHHRGGLPLSTLLRMDVTKLASLRQVADATGENGPEHPPGTVFSYSDDGADTIGALVEVASGQGLATFVQTRIFDPLDMDDAIPVVAIDHEKRARIASDYEGSPGKWKRFWSPKDPPIFPVLLASQALYCTPLDYAKFLSVWKDRGTANGKQLLSLRTVRRALAPGVEMNYPTGFAGLSLDYGEMWILYVDRSQPEKPRVVAFGHGGSDGTFAYCFPEIDLIALYFTQARGTESGFAFEAELQKLVVDPLLRMERAPPVAYAPADFDALAGEYWNAEHERMCVLSRRGPALRIEFAGLGSSDLKATPTKDRFTLALSAADEFGVVRDEKGAPIALDAHSKLPSGEPISIRFDLLVPGREPLTTAELAALRKRAADWERLDALGGCRIRGKIEMPERKLSGTFTTLARGTTRFRNDLDLGQVKVQVVYDGARAWMHNSAAAPQELSGIELEQTRFDHPFRKIADWSAFFASMRVVAKAHVRGRDAWVVRAYPPTSSARTLFVDAETGVLLSEAFTPTIPGVGELGVWIDYDDWRAVAGIQLPFQVTVEYASPLLGTTKISYDAVETNVDVAADAFQLTQAK